MTHQKLTTGLEEYRLPGLEYDGKKIYCGLCGKGFTFLALHILQTHKYSLDDYREKFSLNRGQPLCTPQYSDKLRVHLLRRGQISVLPLPCHLHGSGKPYRRQGRLTIKDSDKVKARQSKNGIRAWGDVPCVICGKLTRGIKTDKRKFYCSECRKIHDSEYFGQWRDEHRETCRQASARYRKNHLEQVRQADREIKRRKHNAIQE
jgi:hypothetical protein